MTWTGTVQRGLVQFPCRVSLRDGALIVEMQFARDEPFVPIHDPLSSDVLSVYARETLAKAQPPASVVPPSFLERVVARARELPSLVHAVVAENNRAGYVVERRSVKSTRLAFEECVGDALGLAGEERQHVALRAAVWALILVTKLEVDGDADFAEEQAQEREKASRKKKRKT